MAKLSIDAHALCETSRASKLQRQGWNSVQQAVKDEVLSSNHLTFHAAGLCIVYPHPLPPSLRQWCSKHIQCTHGPIISVFWGKINRLTTNRFVQYSMSTGSATPIHLAPNLMDQKAMKG